MTFGTSYFGNQILRHLKKDMLDLRRQGFDFVVHTFSEFDLAFNAVNLKSIVAISHDAGLRVYLDPWGVGNVFGGEPFSDFVTEHYQDACQVLDDGTITHLACPNAPAFHDFLRHWTTTAIESGTDGIFWDEPHFHSPDFLKGFPNRWGCRCPHCQQKFQNLFGTPLPIKETSEVQHFKRMSIIELVRFLTQPVTTAGLENILYLPANLPAAQCLSEWEACAEIEAIDTLSTGPYWMWFGKPVASVAEYAQALHQVARKYNKKHLLWLQGCKIKAGREGEIRQAYQLALSSGIHNFAVWGFEGCGQESWIACANPQLAWRILLKIVKQHKNLEILNKQF